MSICLAIIVNQTKSTPIGHLADVLLIVRVDSKLQFLSRSILVTVFLP